MPLRRLLGFVLATALLSLALHLPIVHAHIPPEGTGPEVGTILDQPPTSVLSWETSSVDGHPVQDSYSFVLAEPESNGHDRVTLMLAVFGAALFAVVVGSLGYLLRRLLGLVEPPPEQPSSEYHSEQH